MDNTFRKVSLKSRGVAFLFDLLIMVFLYFGIFIVAAFFSLQKNDLTYSFAVFIVITYCLLKDGNERISIGKKNSQILVINKSNNKQISFLLSFVRQSASFISVLVLNFTFIHFGIKVPPYAIIPLLVLFGDLLLINFSPIGQRIGDIIANTQVVYKEDFEESERNIETMLIK